MTNPVLIAHFPGLQIAEPRLGLAGGELVRLSFEEWNALDGAFPYADQRYQGAEPVFWVKELEGTETFGTTELAGRSSAAVWPVHIAFLLDTPAPLLPTPSLSCSYLRLQAPEFSELGEIIESAVIRLIGPLEREFIVYGSPLRYRYGATDIARVERMQAFLVDHAAALDNDLSAAIGTLEETARPDSWYAGDARTTQAHGFVRCVAACESLLIPPSEERGDASLTQTFGRHAALLLTLSATDVDAAVEHFAALYGLRSDLMHGRGNVDEREASTWARLGEGRRLLRYVIAAGLLLRASVPDGPPLWRWLSRAWADPGRRGEMMAILHTAARS